MVHYWKHLPHRCEVQSSDLPNPSKCFVSLVVDTYVNIQLWKSESFSHAFCLIYWGMISQLKPECTYLTSSAIQFALATFCLPYTTKLIQHLLGFWGTQMYTYTYMKENKNTSIILTLSSRLKHLCMPNVSFSCTYSSTWITRYYFYMPSFHSINFLF